MSFLKDVNENKGERLRTLLAWLTCVTMVVALYAVFIYAPPERVMGIVQKIFYFHLATVSVSFVAFFVVFVAGIGYLLSRDLEWDVLSIASAEIGIVFAAIGLVTGSLWAKPIWGAWWTWDPRLTTFLILWFLYIAYFMLRQAVAEESQRARFAAVFGIVAFLDVPIVFMAARWWRAISPVVITTQGFAMDPAMTLTLLISIAAFLFLFCCLLIQRVRLEGMKIEVEELKQALGQR
ncbi:MAG: cytochrome c biogenesis protein CcsA [Chloroflexi bacterium]|nr:cytochrome c biogenesis protein CcsA [Chloroflexota bacterium]MCL5075429.1 cytochrome c biogenesis protein CcsA [Chloroflexota bacterium]